MIAWCLLLGLVTAVLAHPLARGAEAAGAAVAGADVPPPKCAAPLLIWTVRLVGLLVVVIGLASG